MCQFASFVVTKNKVYYKEGLDSHEDIISHFELQSLDTEQNLGLIRVEITPNIDTPENLKSWNFEVDQDKYPDWSFYGDPDIEERVYKALEERAVNNKWFISEQGNKVIVGYKGTAKSGKGGTSVSGEEGTSKSETFGTSISGDFGTATSGDFGTATSGNYGSSISGKGGTSVSGDFGIATSENNGFSRSGKEGISKSEDCGNSISGNRGTSISKDNGISISGYKGTSISGDNGTSITGVEGKVKAGKGGRIEIEYYTYDRICKRKLIGYIGEDGLEPDVFYKVVDGKFVKYK